MNRSIVLALLVTFIAPTYQTVAQDIIVADLDLKTGIPYATITDIESGQGFVTDEFGHVHLNGLSNEASLEFRSIGYDAVQGSANDLQDGDTIFLKALILELEEVIVRPIDAFSYVQKSLRSVKRNYYPDSFSSKHYYRESVTENGHYLTYTEAFLTALQPGYFVEKDSFAVFIDAGRKMASEQLAFMEKERDKMAKKDEKKSARKGEAFNPEDYDFSLELGDPSMLLAMDPLRHPERVIEVNDDNVDFLDSINHKYYDYWYGKPVAHGKQTLVVVHFDQKKRVRKPLMAGTLWIDQATDALVKVSFGFSEHGTDHIVPTYAKALMWIYGLSFNIGKNKLEFEYTDYQGYYTLAAVRMKAVVDLEKRHFFVDNEHATFDYACEMLTTSIHALDAHKQLGNPYEADRVLSEQLPEVSDEEWKALKLKSRKRQY